MAGVSRARVHLRRRAHAAGQPGTLTLAAPDVRSAPLIDFRYLDEDDDVGPWSRACAMRWKSAKRPRSTTGEAVPIRSSAPTTRPSPRSCATPSSPTATRPDRAGWESTRSRWSTSAARTRAGRPAGGRRVDHAGDRLDQHQRGHGDDRREGGRSAPVTSRVRNKSSNSSSRTDPADSGTSAVPVGQWRIIMLSGGRSRRTSAACALRDSRKPGARHPDGLAARRDPRPRRRDVDERPRKRASGGDPYTMVE